MSASWTSTPPDNSLLREHILLFKACASACAFPTPWNAVPQYLLSKFWFFQLVVLALLLL